MMSFLRYSRKRAASLVSPFNCYVHALPHVLQTQGVPIYLYLHPDEVEPEALQQLRTLAESGLAERFVSVMPDVHLGKGATVGSVFASKEFVVPNGVGVDIGCGMAAIPVANLWKDDLIRADGSFVPSVFKVQELIKQLIPTGFNSHRTPLPGALDTVAAILRDSAPSEWLAQLVAGSAKVGCQLGSLGGGNHFLEVLADEGGQVWLMLHSGSRWVGNHTANHYNELAMLQMRADGRPAAAGGRGGLNSLRIASEEGAQYLQDMLWCQAYALANRRAMLRLMMDVVQRVFGRQAEQDRLINTHHNFCSCERCTFTDPATGAEVTESLWITRKGATAAAPGQLGLIPGSMGTGSFVVEGKGEPRSWSSCSHGAGRRLSRTKAFELVAQADFERSLDGIVCDRDAALRDEAPQAYKDLETVMSNQESLVAVRHRLTPLINVKGFGASQPAQRTQNAPRAGKG